MIDLAVHSVLVATILDILLFVGVLEKCCIKKKKKKSDLQQGYGRDKF